MYQPNRSSLVLGELFQCVYKARLDGRNPARFWGRQHWPLLAAGLRLADPEEVADRVRQLGELLAVFPAPGKGFGQRIGCSLNANSAGECAAKPGFSLSHKDLKVGRRHCRSVLFLANVRCVDCIYKGRPVSYLIALHQM